MGWTQGHVRLIPVKSDTEQTKIDEWLAGSQQITLVENTMDDTIKQRLNSALPFIESTMQRVKDGKIETRSLEADHSGN